MEVVLFITIIFLDKRVEGHKVAHKARYVMN